MKEEIISNNFDCKLMRFRLYSYRAEFLLNDKQLRGTLFWGLFLNLDLMGGSHNGKTK